MILCIVANEIPWKEHSFHQLHQIFTKHLVNSTNTEEPDNPVDDDNGDNRHFGFCSLSCMHYFLAIIVVVLVALFIVVVYAVWRKTRFFIYHGQDPVAFQQVMPNPATNYDRGYRHHNILQMQNDSSETATLFGIISASQSSSELEHV